MAKGKELSFLTTKGKKLSKNIKEKLKKAKQEQSGTSGFVKEFLGDFLSEKTKRAYMKDLEIFFQFLHEAGEVIKSPSSIKAYHFSVYRDWMLEQNFSPATVNRRLVCIRSFMKWALAKNLIDYNPLDAVKLPKVQTVSPTQAFTDIEVIDMIAAPDITTPKGNTHRLIIIMLFHLGLRRSEIVNLKWQDISTERGHQVLRIHGKGDKVRLVPLPEATYDEIMEYKEKFYYLTELELEKNDYIVQLNFKTKNQTPVDGSTIYRVVSRYAKNLGIDKKVGAHSCRATVISHLLDTQHASIRDVADFAGHSQITTTQRYDKKRKGLDNNAAYKVDYDEDTKESA